MHFSLEAVVPIYHVPYPRGKDDSRDNFAPMMPTELEQEYKPHPQKLYTSSIAIQPPPSFRPVPVRDNDPIPRPAPPSLPPKPFKDTRIFENVDMHAVEVGTHLFHRCFPIPRWLINYKMCLFECA